MKMVKTASTVKTQYERFPYPPVGRWALPATVVVEKLALARLSNIAPEYSLPRDQLAMRILVVGCGTLEPLLVARANPQCRELVAIDLSANSVDRLIQRWRWAQQLQQLKIWRRKLFKTTLQAQAVDLLRYQGTDFDFIVASNVLHHTADPAAALYHLAQQLKPNGVLRVVTYPKMSRYWLRLTGEWLRWHGIDQQTPSLLRRSRQAIACLPSDHPIRLCFATHRESGSATGVVDAFLHALENPLTPHQWGIAARKAGLQLIAEDQHPLSQSNFLVQLLPEAKQLAPWDQLQILDDSLELSTNLVLWFGKAGESETELAEQGAGAGPPPAQPQVNNPHLLASTTSIEEVISSTDATLSLPSRIFWELGTGLRDAATRLAPIGVPVQQLIEQLRQEVGTHMSSDGTRCLTGFAASDYDTAALLVAPAPWTIEQWNELDSRGPWRLQFEDQFVPGDSLAAQAQWLQLRYGFSRATIPVRLLAC